MLKIKISLLKRINILIGFLLALLGFSCSKNNSGDDDIYVEYGVPSASFVVEGIVKSATTTSPIPDIQVIMGYDTTYTDESGKYMIEQYAFPDDTTFVVGFKDIDGSNNGSYADLDTTAIFKDPEYTDGDGWFAGTATKTLDVELENED